MKLNKEIISYILFGIMTTLVNLTVYVLLTSVFAWHYQVATVTAWIAAVLFAYFTNKSYVFKAKYSNIFLMFKSFGVFVFYRVLSLLVDLFVMYVLIEIFYINDLVTKIIANIIVVMFNYLTSKWFVFKESSSSS
ncbi:GtrA family protein [Gracilibacillus salinarum]|uniref:GtrA family protein n=1 Tax=Gracilibacillus salinarum TaxID=2932255 RepID=A0ABY4GT23_9BACI|nr:GtrA family protein [Gracilibacillus salinarum]UOQ86822.1 GtrA family protein [Gracilibacillus salinarum]